MRCSSGHDIPESVVRDGDELIIDLARSSSADFSRPACARAPQTGLVTTAMVGAQRPWQKLHHDRRRCAGSGPTAGSPAVMKTMSEPSRTRGDRIRIFLGRPLASGAVPAGTKPAGDLVADPDLVRRV